MMLLMFIRTDGFSRDHWFEQMCVIKFKMWQQKKKRLTQLMTYLLKSILIFPLWYQDSIPLSRTAHWVAMTATRRLNPEALKPYRTRKVHKKPKPRITIAFTSWNSAREMKK